MGADPNALQTFLASPLGQFAANAALQILYDGAKSVFGRVTRQDPVQTAIARTCSALDNPSGLSRALHAWAKDRRVAGVARDYRRDNHGRIDFDELAALLLRTAGIEYGRHLDWPKPEVVLRLFFQELTWTAVDAPQWVPVLDERAEERNAEVIGELRSGVAQLVEGQKTFFAAISERSGQRLPAVPRRRLQQSRGTGSLVKLHAKAKRLQKKLRFRSAYELFLAVADAEPAGTLRFAALKGAGHCAYRLGDKRTAAKHYAQAARLRAGSDEGVACRVRALIWRGQHGAALRVLAPLLRKKPSKGTYRAAEAESLLELGKHAAAASVFLGDQGKLRVPNWRRSSTVCYVLAYVFLRSGKATEALTWARRTLELKPADIGNQELFAAACVELLTKDQGPEWTRKSSSTRLAKRAEALLTKEVVALEGTDDIAMRVNAHVNRAAIRIWLHAPDSAAEDCEAAMAEDPSCSLAYAHLTNARILQDRAEDAVKVFEQAKNRGPNTPPLEGLAYGLLSLGKYSLAVEVTDKYGNLGEADHVDLGVALAAVESRISAGQLERAEQLLTKLFSEYKEHCRVSLVRAHLCERRGDFGAAMEALRMAETQVTEANERTLVNMQSAGFFSRRGTWDEAIRHYEAFIQSEVNDDLTKDYVRCLYNSSDRGRNIPRCRTICTAMRRRLGAVMPYAALEASIEENLGNVESALHIYSELLKTRPEDTAVKLRIAALQARLAKPQAAASILATIDLASIDRAESHVMIAQILSSADKDVEALDILFRAYRRFPNSRELNLAYMWLMTARGQRLTAKLAQASVDGDSGVEIVYDDEKRDYLLTTAPNPDPGLHEITSTTGLGVALLGHVEGDSFQFHDGLRECKVDVKAVFSKYVFIFRTIMGNFPVKFPDFPGFHRIPVNLQSPDPLKDLMPVFEALRRQTDSALKLYRVLPLFITTLSGLLAKDLIATCQILMGDEEGFLHCSEGTRNEQVYEDVVTNNATGAVVDGTALVTMTLLGMELDTSPKLKRLYVSQSLYDAIHVQCIRDHETMENQAAAHGTELPSPERVFSCQSFKLLEKTERSGRDLPRKMQGSEEEDDIDHMVEDSIDLCTRLKLPLWSDDYRLRAALRQRSGIPSFSTLAVLRSALFAGTLKPAEYGDALARLLLSNYRLIPLNGRILFHLFELTSYRLTPAVERCLRTLESPGISLSSLLGAIADSITSLWLIKLVPIERPQLVLRLRDVVARRDPRAESIRALSAMIEHRLRLYPQAVKEIHELLKPGPGGIILPG